MLRAKSTTSTLFKLQKRFNSNNFAGNVGDHIASKIGKNLHLQPNHPLQIINKTIQNYFTAKHKQGDASVFQVFDSMNPKVTVKQNFDDLLFPMDHVSRQPSDTYFYDANNLLRTHTTAHQVELIKKGHEAFLISGDVYRRDDIDASHYPVFHQMDGVRIFTKEQAKGEDFEQFIVKELKGDLEGLAKNLFGNVQMRWIDAYFPFTDPSFELEIYFQDRWLEVLGCGLIHRTIMTNQGFDLSTHRGYAFGLGLERLAMVLFDIPDIRLFWTQDKRFLDQFKSGKIIKFKPYSKYPSCYKDVSFWLPENFKDNDFYELVRQVAGEDLIENVSVVDDFTHPKTKQRSKCFRINYQSMDRNLTNEEIDQLQFKLREQLKQKLGVTLR